MTKSFTPPEQSYSPRAVWFDAVYEGVRVRSGWRKGIEEAVKASVDEFHFLAGAGIIDVSTARALDGSRVHLVITLGEGSRS